MKRPAHRRRQAGMSLIEVLTAVLIFSLGILGLVGLQARATQFSVSAEDTNRAALLASELVTTLWLNQQAPGAGPVLPPEALAAWTAQVADPAAGGLPNGVGDVVIKGEQVDITLTWKSPNAATADPVNRYSTQVRIRW